MTVTTYNAPQRVSLHGGHSGQFCHHAKDNLEEIVREYIRQGFSWVGLTEHVPPVSDRLRYQDEVEAGLSQQFLYRRFADYIQEARRLQDVYSDQIRIFAGMEIETCSGCLEFAHELRDIFTPDYIVGSVHFVDDICFDYSRSEYNRAVSHCGSLEQLYCRYFDLQYQMIEELRPEVVGHFDLIRLFDDQYRERITQTGIQDKILRNLKRIRQYDLILDFNMRAMLKGADEPYISRSILLMARDLGIRIAPGDDSHSIDSVGCSLDRGIAILEELGISTNWPLPSD